MYLGIVINENLSFNAHVDYIRKKASKKVGMMKRIKHKMEIEQRISIY